METLVIIGRIAQDLCTVVFPQVLGVLLYFRLHRAPGWVRVIASTLAPAVIFFFLAPILLFAGLREAQVAGKLNCGMPAMGAILLLYVGTIFQLFMSLIVQGVLFRRRRRQI